MGEAGASDVGGNRGSVDGHDSERLVRQGGRNAFGVQLNADLSVILEVVIQAKLSEGRPDLIGVAKRENRSSDDRADGDEEGKQP